MKRSIDFDVLRSNPQQAAAQLENLFSLMPLTDNGARVDRIAVISAHAAISLKELCRFFGRELKACRVSALGLPQDTESLNLLVKEAKLVCVVDQEGRTVVALAGTAVQNSIKRGLEMARLQLEAGGAVPE